VGDPRHILGRRAERAVGTWLKGHGWRILAERHRSAGSEIDVLAIDPSGCLVAVEVKLRRSGRAGLPVEAVTSDAVRRRRAALARYATTGRVEHRCLRVDVVSVTPGPEPGTWRLVRHPGVDGW
jgi:Holliday junction resolvase-like predicted endonuclease